MALDAAADPKAWEGQKGEAVLVHAGVGVLAAALQTMCQLYLAVVDTLGTQDQLKMIRDAVKEGGFGWHGTEFEMRQAAEEAAGKERLRREAKAAGGKAPVVLSKSTSLIAWRRGRRRGPEVDTHESKVLHQMFASYGDGE
jgi:hypothetical protein